MRWTVMCATSVLLFCLMGSSVFAESEEDQLLFSFEDGKETYNLYLGDLEAEDEIEELDTDTITRIFLAYLAQQKKKVEEDSRLSEEEKQTELASVEEQIKNLLKMNLFASKYTSSVAAFQYQFAGFRREIDSSKRVIRKGVLGGQIGLGLLCVALKNVGSISSKESYLNQLGSLVKAIKCGMSSLTGVNGFPDLSTVREYTREARSKQGRNRVPRGSTLILPLSGKFHKVGDFQKWFGGFTVERSKETDSQTETPSAAQTGLYFNFEKLQPVPSALMLVTYHSKGRLMRDNKPQFEFVFPAVMAGEGNYLRSPVPLWFLPKNNGFNSSPHAGDQKEERFEPLNESYQSFVEEAMRNLNSVFDLGM